MVDDQATIEIDDREPVLVVALGGEVDMANAEDLTTDLRRALAGRSAVVLDLSGLSFVDSSGCRMLTVLGREARAAGQVLHAVCPPTSPVRRVMEITAVPDDLPVFSDRASARQALGPQST